VRIGQNRYRELKAYFSDLAIQRSKEWLEEQLRRLPFEPYAPVRSQVFGILREVNRRRQLAGYELIVSSCLRIRRRVVRPFEEQLVATTPRKTKELAAA
jgi:hypothetical protein